jgi:uncharacterized membrane protein
MMILSKTIMAGLDPAIAMGAVHPYAVHFPFAILSPVG